MSNHFQSADIAHPILVCYFGDANRYYGLAEMKWPLSLEFTEICKNQNLNLYYQSSYNILKNCDNMVDALVAHVIDSTRTQANAVICN